MKPMLTKSNFQFLIKELIKTLSTKESYFSKKRLESAIAFGIGQIGMITYLIIAIHKMEVLDIMGWATIEFAIAGYYVKQIQKEK